MGGESGGDRRRSLRRLDSARLLTPTQALSTILDRLVPAAAAEVVRLDKARGRVLASDVVSDLDLPPFEKSAMDGYAVRSGDFPYGPRSLRVVGESKAGMPYPGAVGPGECVAIYTGAEVPADCDAVVMVEKSRRPAPADGESADGDAVEVVQLDDKPRPWQHVCRVGEDLKKGETTLVAGKRLTAIDLSVLAAVGCEYVPVRPRPRVALLTTGDELVPVSSIPRNGQIREGNTYYLAARLEECGAQVENLGIVPDDESQLERVVRAVLSRCDVLITTGGVSMGKYDIVGGVLEKVGFEPVFHKVSIKPGKPLWFGMCGPTPVFALPGNPVSCLIGFEVFVRPALAKLEAEGVDAWEDARLTGRWRGGPTKPNDRQQNLPVRVVRAADGADELVPLAWTSSADIVELSRAQGLAIVEPGRVVSEGEVLEWRPLPS